MCSQLRSLVAGGLKWEPRMEGWLARARRVGNEQLDLYYADREASWPKPRSAAGGRGPEYSVAPQLYRLL